MKGSSAFSLQRRHRRPLTSLPRSASNRTARPVIQAERREDARGVLAGSETRCCGFAHVTLPHAVGRVRFPPFGQAPNHDRLTAVNSSIKRIMLAVFVGLLVLLASACGSFIVRESRTTLVIENRDRDGYTVAFAADGAEPDEPPSRWSLVDDRSVLILLDVAGEAAGTVSLFDGACRLLGQGHVEGDQMTLATIEDRELSLLRISEVPASAESTTGGTGPCDVAGSE